MKVYLLRIDAKRRCFYAETSRSRRAEGDEPEPPKSRTRFGRTIRRWRVGFHRGQRSGTGRRLGQVWAWLRRFTMPDEPLLHRLRHARKIELYHPMTMEPGDALTTWRHYLAHRGRRHMFWGAIDGLLCPITVLLAALPGPNVFGYWFVYRAGCHLLAALGVRRAATLEVETHTDPTGLLDATMADPEAVEQIVAVHELKGLGEFLDREAPDRRAADEAAVGPGAC